MFATSALGTWRRFADKPQYLGYWGIAAAGKLSARQIL
jgi:hypothetical protein